MRGTLIPVTDFLNAAIRACSQSPAGEAQPGVGMHGYAGLVVVLDRKAERCSRLLEDLVDEGSSINDVTRRDLVILLSGLPEESSLVADEWVIDPNKDWDGVGAPDMAVVAGSDYTTRGCVADEAREAADARADAWSRGLWELLSNKVERCQDDESQRRIADAIDSSASAISDYLGLGEADIPSLVLFSLSDKRLFVFRYGGDADNPPYQLFKEIAVRRPTDEHPGWLTDAIIGVAGDWGLQEGPIPSLAPSVLGGWTPTRYMPRGVETLDRETARV